MMIPILLPIVAVFLVILGLLLNDHGLVAIGDPIVVIAALFLVGVCCIPLFRRIGTQQWFAKLPWLGLCLLWNGLGAIFALYVIVSFILSVSYSVHFFGPPGWCMAVFFWLWFLPIPFSTFAVTILLWRGRSTLMSKVLLLYSMAILALWCCLVVMSVAIV